MTEPTPADMLELAQKLGVEAIEFTKPYAGQVASRLKDDASVVTEVDHAVQRHIVSAVAEKFPDHAFLAEESLDAPDSHPDRATARYCWVIDPIDGTRNFVAGFACFGTSIAVLDRGTPVAAVVVEHNLGHVYTATLNGGAFLGDRRLEMPEPDPERDVMVGIPSSKDRLTQRVVLLWQGTRGLITRNLGSSAVHLGMLASGALGAMFCKKCKIWDVAAGVLLVSEAGGRVTDPTGEAILPFDLTGDPNADTPILAAAPNIHQRLLAGIRSVAT